MHNVKYQSSTPDSKLHRVDSDLNSRDTAILEQCMHTYNSLRDLIGSARTCFATHVILLRHHCNLGSINVWCGYHALKSCVPSHVNTIAKKQILPAISSHLFELPAEVLPRKQYPDTLK